MATGIHLESRSETIERMKKGKAAYEKRQVLIKKINKSLKLAK